MVPIIALLLLSAAAHSADDAPFDRPLASLERKIVDKRSNGLAGADEFSRLEAELAVLRTMQEEAVADGVVTAEERAELRQAIRSLEAQVEPPRPIVRAAKIRPASVMPGAGRVTRTKI